MFSVYLSLFNKLFNGYFKRELKKSNSSIIFYFTNKLFLKKTRGVSFLVFLSLSSGLFCFSFPSQALPSLSKLFNSDKSNPEKASTLGLDILKAINQWNASLVEKILPSVVNISTTSTVQLPRRVLPLQRALPFGMGMPPLEESPDLNDFFSERTKRSSLGSGFIIDPEGHIVTNYHVIADAEKILVKLSDDSEFEAKVIGVDKRADIALLKIDVSYKLPFLALGDSSKVQTGHQVFAIGNPHGLGGTVTSGIISNRSRDLSAKDIGLSVSEYVNELLQIDAAVNIGNSGGPSIDIEGNVIGMNTIIYSPTGGSIGLAFAIPSKVVNHSIKQIKQYGKARHGWIGVFVQPMTEEIAASLELKEIRGGLITTLLPQSPAAKAGLKIGDVILKYNNIEIKDSSPIPRLVAETPTGKEIPLVIWRDSKEQKIMVIIEEYEAAEEAGLIPNFNDEPRALNKEGEILGLEINALNNESRERFEIKESLKGVVISNVKRDSEAWTRGFRPGNLILSVNQQLVETPEQVIAIVEEARKSQKKTPLLFLVTRADDIPIFAALNFDPKEK